MNIFSSLNIKKTTAILLAMFFLLGCNNGSHKQMPYQTNIFPQVKVPVSIAQDKRLGAEYVARHYWDEFLSEDRLLRLGPSKDSTSILGVSRQIFDESFGSYVSLIENVDDTIARHSMQKLVNRAVYMAENGYPQFFSTIMQTGEKILFDAYSPMLDDELYLPVLDGIEKCKAIPDSVKQSFRYQQEICSKNRVGTTAADFRYTSQRGTSNMHSIKAEFLLIFFNDPDCPNCRQALEIMKKSDVILNMVGMGVMKVLAVSPNGKSELWAERMADFPTDWIYAYDPDGELNKGTSYTLRTSPSIYLLDENKNVIVKDGVSAKRISTISYGKERPLVQGSGEKVWKWNRNATTTVK